MQRRTWFGMNAVVEVGPRWFHRAGLGPLLIPHPPLVNWLLRWGLTNDARNALSIAHEFGHLQTTPPALVYTGILVGALVATGHAGWLALLFGLISAHAAWEITAEIVTKIRTGPFYAESYRGRSTLPRFLFWVFTGGLTIAGWLLVFG